MKADETPEKQESAPKERLLQTAAQLFYRYVYRAVGAAALLRTAVCSLQA